MNPYLRMLLNLLHAQRVGQMRSGLAGDKASGGMDPEAMKYAGQLNSDYWNPGGGTQGNDTVGGGSVFGGFYRGNPLSSYYGVRPDVGNTGWLRGGASGFNQAPAWGAQNWLLQLLQSPNLSNPYNAPQSGNWLTGEQIGPQYHGGGPGMAGFLSGGGSLASMDSLARGGTGSDSLGSPSSGRYAE